MGDDFVSVEHLVLAFPSDARFGKRLFTNLNLTEKSLKDAVEAVRGNQKVTDQSINILSLFQKLILFFSFMKLLIIIFLSLYRP